MKILLLSCCAPCCCAVIEKMARDGYDFAVAFYNPNIVPAAEYEKRREENRRLCEGRKIPFIELEYDNERWRNLIKGLENEPERGRRCDVCFYMRLKRVMEYARENGFDAVASVLPRLLASAKHNFYLRSEHRCLLPESLYRRQRR